MSDSRRRHSEDDEDEDVEYALGQLDLLLGLPSISDSHSLDEKAKLVLHSLLNDGSFSKQITAPLPTCTSLTSLNKRNTYNSHDKPNYGKALLRTASQASHNQASSSSSPSSYHRHRRHPNLPLPPLLELESPNAKTRKCVSRQTKNRGQTRRKTRTSASPSFSSSYSSSPTYTTQKQANSTSSSSTSGGNERRTSMRASRRININPSRNKEEGDIGRFQRFKNKLGLIFHHHHHHHHHHHDAEADRVTNDKALSKHNHSFWNYLHKTTHGTPTTNRKDKVGGGVVDGLARHIWHSNKTDKKPKRSHSRNSAVVVNKWHWWQKFYKRKGVVRQNSNNRKRGKVKFGFTAAKRPPRVPALKFN